MFRTLLLVALAGPILLFAGPLDQADPGKLREPKLFDLRAQWLAHHDSGAEVVYIAEFDGKRWRNSQYRQHPSTDPISYGNWRTTQPIRRQPDLEYPGLYYKPPGQLTYYELHMVSDGSSTVSARSESFQYRVPTHSSDFEHGVRLDAHIQLKFAPAHEGEFAQQGVSGNLRFSLQGQWVNFTVRSDLAKRFNESLQAGQRPDLEPLPDILEVKGLFQLASRDSFFLYNGPLFPNKGGLDLYEYYLAEDGELFAQDYDGHRIVDERDLEVRFRSGIQYYLPNPHDAGKEPWLNYPNGEQAALKPMLGEHSALLTYLQMPKVAYSHRPLRTPCELFLIGK